MKLTKRQQDEKECLEWFGEDLLKQFPSQKGELEEYFAHSERGIPIKGFQRGRKRFNVYSECKKWRGRFCEKGANANEPAIYAEGILDGSMPYYVILGGYIDEKPMPRVVVDYLKKALFKGIDAELIEECYQNILREKATLN